MFEIKHHNFRYRSRLPIKNEVDSFTSEPEPFKSLFKNKLHKVLPYSVSGTTSTIKKEKVQLQPIKTEEKFRIPESKPQSTSNKRSEQQNTVHPRVTGQFFFRYKKNMNASFKYGRTNDSFLTCRGKSQFTYFADSVKGKRSYNEDRFICKENCGSFREATYKPSDKKSEYSLFGVFDGHGGSHCSEFIKNNIHQILSSSKNILMNPEAALEECFTKLEEKFIAISEKKGALETSGSCAIVALLFSSKIFLANLGDSRALLLNIEKVNQLSKDHKPEDSQEKMRIIKHGGKIYKQEGKKNFQEIKVFTQTRIMPGSLNVSRTIGDIEIKLRKYGGSPGMIISEPDITVHESDPSSHLLLASDGLFEGLTNQEIHRIYVKNRKEHGFSESEVLLRLIGNELIKEASEKSRDNITLILVKLQ